MHKLILHLSGKVLTLCLLLCVFTGVAYAQKVTVTGVVTGNADKQPVIGATVAVENGNGGTITDMDGSYEIEMDQGKVLKITAMGYNTQVFTINESQVLNVELAVETSNVDEVVVIGYGTARKSHLTGAVSKVGGTNLAQIPVSRPEQALQGKLAGVTIQTTDAQAGAAPTIQVRGAASITAGTKPLIVIDGYPVPTDLSAIDMNDVESVEVLKDAASAAIYGSRGANGVVLITTKSGKDGKPEININASTGFKQVYRRLNFYNLSEWEGYVRSVNNGNSTPEIDAAKKFDANQDIEDIMFRTAAFSNLQASVSGGNKDVQYYLGGGAVFDKGAVLGNDYKKYNFKANVKARLSDKLQVGVDINTSYALTNLMPLRLHDALRTLSTWQPLQHNEATSAVTGKPVGSDAHQRDFDPTRNPVYKATGLPNLSQTGDNNGYVQMTNIVNKLSQQRNVLNAFAKYNFTPDFSFRTSAGYFTGIEEETYFQPSFTKSDPILQGVTTARANTLARLGNVKTTDLLSENLFNFNKSFGKHYLDAIAGFSAQRTTVNEFSGSANNFASDNIETLNAGTMTSLSSYRQAYTLASFLARVNYSYGNKYLVSVASRWDGSSRFGVDSRWGSFPSASLGWRVSEEGFWPKNKVVSNLKLRASYGVTGNNNIGNYRSYASMDPVGAILGSNVTPGYNLSTYANPNLGWERTFSYNGGVDLGLFNERISIGFDIYRSVTDQLLLYMPLPYITGFEGYWTNAGKVQNSGVELELNASIVSTSKVQWSATLVGSANKNKLTEFNSDELISTGDPKRVNYFLTQVGSPLVQFYGYEVDKELTLDGSNYWPIGIKAERVFVKDQNGDGKITDADRIALGSPYPKLTWGFTNNLKVGSFDLSITLQGSHGAKVLNIDPNYYEIQFNTTGSSAYLKYTAEEQSRMRYKSETDYNVQDASYIALRNVNIGYSMNEKLLKKTRLPFSGIRIYASAANLWYHFASDYTSYNPEGINEYLDDPLRKGYQRGAAPITRTVTFGLNLGL